MANLVVREVCEREEAVRREIVQAATEELRRTYRPTESGNQCGGAPSGVLVALKGNMLVGTAEYVLMEAHVYVRGVAVHPKHRGHGICRALVGKAEEIARKKVWRLWPYAQWRRQETFEYLRSLGSKLQAEQYHKTTSVLKAAQ